MWPYHINTARTTIYEQADYPLRPFKELSVNSFHYNHIWPHMSLMLDFLVTDFFDRSRGAIDFPSRYIEGYAYLQSKLYGDRPGKFFERDDAVLWLPQRLLKTSGTVELNYLADVALYLAFANQSPESVTTEVTLNAAVLPSIAGKSYPVNGLVGTSGTTMRDGKLSITVAPMGMTAIEIGGLAVAPKFQDSLVGAKATDAWRHDYLSIGRK